jgi:hypothetical protein
LSFLLFLERRRARISEKRRRKGERGKRKGGETDENRIKERKKSGVDRVRSVGGKAGRVQSLTFWLLEIQGIRLPRTSKVSCLPFPFGDV